VVETGISFYSISKMDETPYRRPKPGAGKSKRKVAHATVLTSSPYKQELAAMKASQLAKTAGKRGKKCESNLPTADDTKAKKPKVNRSKATKDSTQTAGKRGKKCESNLPTTDNIKAKKPKVKSSKAAKDSTETSARSRQRLQKEKSTTHASTSDATVPCLYCGDLFGESTESWIQ